MAEVVHAEHPGWADWLRQEFKPDTLLPSVLAGLILGVIDVTVAIAFASLIFSGDLSGHLADGIGLMLFGAIILNALTALTSSYRGLVATLQDSPAAILALVSAAIIDKTATRTEAFYTVVAALSLVSFLTGGAFLLLGQFRLGNLIRFIPYPVIGGFLAGTGLLLALGAISVMTGESVSFTHMDPMIDPDSVVMWLPGLVFAVLLLVILRRFSHVLIVPGMLVGGIVIFYAVLLLTGTSVSEATDHGWLLDVFPDVETSRVWQPLSLSDLKQVDWTVLLGQVGNLLAIGIVSTIALLLNATGIELATERDINLNRELKAAGLSNLLAGLGGSMPGFHALGPTVLASRLGVKGRLVGIVLAGVCTLVLFAGGTLLSYFPNPVLGGLLLFLGLDFLVEWVYDAWFRLPLADYLIVIAILIVISAVGFLEGIGLGLALAVVLFVVNYSRIDVVKHTLTGTTYRSNVLRATEVQERLREQGNRLYILKLQGALFFGTANKVLDQVRERLDDPTLPPLECIVLDFHLVNSLDSSAVLSFAKMKQLAQQRQFALVFCALSPEFQHKLFQNEENSTWQQFPDVDHGVEWCENRLLHSLETMKISLRAPTLEERLQEVLSDPDYVARFMRYLEQQTVEANHYLMRQDEPPQGLYFIETGQVTVQLEMEDDRPVRLRKMDAGTMVGEIGTYLNQPATASVVTNQPSILYRLSLDALKRLENDDPEVAAAFHRYMVHFMAARLTHTTETLQALVD